MDNVVPFKDSGGGVVNASVEVGCERGMIVTAGRNCSKLNLTPTVVHSDGWQWTG
jgi:hypothetical protein